LHTERVGQPENNVQITLYTINTFHNRLKSFYWKGKVSIMDKVFKFIEWIYTNYGTLGCAAALLIVIVALILVFIFLSRLPESKK